MEQMVQPNPQLVALSDPELFTQIRAILDSIDDANETLSKLKAGLDDHESEVKRRMMERGSFEPGSSMKAAGLSFTVQQKWRAKYDPALWPKIVEWAVREGVSHIIQRRLSDKPIMELVDSGKGLPEGLGVESFLDLQHRRS